MSSLPANVIRLIMAVASKIAVRTYCRSSQRGALKPFKSESRAFVKGGDKACR